MANSDIRIAVQDLDMVFDTYVVQRDVNFSVRRGSVFIVMGASGCGKSTLLKHMIGLERPARGDIYYDGEGFWAATSERRMQISRRFGVLFQSGALWSSMTLAENVALPLHEYTKLGAAEIAELVSLKLALVGLRGFEDTIRPRSAAACASAPVWRAPWRSIPTSCSSTSPRPASIRSARSGSTT